MQTILGGNGTIGSVLAKELAAYTDRIRLVSRNPKKINVSDELFAADLSDATQVEKAIEGSAVVYLLIGFDYNIKVWREKWPKLMRATIDACKKHNAKLVFFDNVYMYDQAEIAHMTEEAAINPTSKKGKVRKEVAEMLLNEVRSGKLTGLIARSADFYGPDNDKSILNELVYKNIKKGKKPNWFMNADKKHSFTYTPDAAKATALLGNTNDAYNQVWHLPTDKSPVTGREMVSMFAKEMNAKDNVFVLPMWLLKLMGLFVPIMKEMPEMMYQYDRDYFFDSSKFDKRFNFKTTRYQQGIKETVQKSK
ncbi:MAG: NAD-dependent dehydratase [Segetibacter sp.]|jgi:nucleoside-diphosphate-sugar epimerase|nr:NAD-dependent dehydratase [Segetibacter sp.]